jgi:cytochrome c biogenesis protein CcmG/thiol:disulfide interchange protein DsbE
MRPPDWFWSFFAGLLVVGLLVGTGPFGQSAPMSKWAMSEQTSREAPNFSLKTLDGTAFRLKDHRGEVVVLNFWATWCPPCRREIPMFVKLQRELGDQGLQFVGVALERSAGPKKVWAFAEKMNMNYPVGLGTGTIAKKYGGVRTLPQTYIIGPDGKIRGHIPGMATESMLRPGLEKLLRKASSVG